MGNYVVETRALSDAISKCVGIIAMGEKSDSNCVTLVFSKVGLSVEARNSTASYVSDVPVTVNKASKARASVLPELLLSYAKSYKELTLIPEEDKLLITSGKSFKAEVFYVGSVDPIDRREPEASSISAIANEANKAIGMVAGFRNRSDNQALGVILSWGDKKLEVTVGDTHHAIIIDSVVKSKDSGTITSTLPNIQKIMSVGSNFASTDQSFYAWSDTEYLQIANLSENIFLADVARAAIIDNKKNAIAKVNTDKFTDMINTLTGAVDETSVLTFIMSEGKLQANIRTNAGTAKASLKLDSFKGKSQSVSVTVHHLRDALSAMKEKDMRIVVLKNMLTLESESKTMKCIAGMMAVFNK